MVRRAETGRVVLFVTARRLISLPLSCLVTALVSSSGLDALGEIIGAGGRMYRAICLCCRVNTSMQRQNISVSAQRTHQAIYRKASPTHPSLLKECQPRAWLYDLAALFWGRTQPPMTHLTISLIVPIHILW